MPFRRTDNPQSDGGEPVDKVTIHTLKRLKQAGQRITMVTAYDATFARILDDAGADMLLVGDSLGMVVQGNESTLPVTMDQMVYHCRAVSRGTKRAHVVGDLPFLSYQASVPEAVKNAGRLLAEGGVSSVKLEGGAEFAETIEAIVRAGIPVMGHLGLTPQSVHRMGGFVVQGREEEQARAIYRDAQALERAGCYALVLEGVPQGAGAGHHRVAPHPHHRHRRGQSTATGRCWSATTSSASTPTSSPSS